MEITTTCNNKNKYSISQIEYMKQVIEHFDMYNQIEILKIINQKSHAYINENIYGTHINLTELQDETLDEMSKYLNHVLIQESTIKKAEVIKSEYYANFFQNE